MDYEYSDVGCWKQRAIKQGYIIRFYRGVFKSPKMKYFVLTSNGLISFEGKPDNDSAPLSFLPFDQLTSIKLDQIELNSCTTLSCMNITNKAATSFLMAFNREEERDEWVLATMTAYSESLASSRGSYLPEAIHEPSTQTYSVSHSKKSSLGRQSFRRKRRKGNRGESLRRARSCGAALHDCTNNVDTIRKTSMDGNPRLHDARLSQELGEKRKSETDLNVVSRFPSAWESDRQVKEFRTSRLEHRDSTRLHPSKKDRDTKSGLFSKILSRHSAK